MPRQLVRLVSVLSAVLAACATTPKPAVTGDADAPHPEDVQASKAATEANQTVAGQPGPDEDVEALDLNGDQKPDAYNFYPKGSLSRDGKPKEGAGGDQPRLLRKEIDLNNDGKIDMWKTYGPDGAVVREAYDLDYDGRVDVVAYYEKGVVIRKEVIHGFSDKPDEYKYYEKGKLVRVERDVNHDGHIDEWEYWEGNEIDRIGDDLNGDGNVDRWVKAKK